MADDHHSAAPPSPSPSSPRRRRRWPLILVAIVLAPLLLFALYTLVAVSYSYSKGDRAGYVQKFSKKGWICKTWEGELAMVNIPGALQERWEFSVRDDSIANVIRQSLGERVSLTYEQHLGVPSNCFAETQYFVVGVHRIDQ